MAKTPAARARLWGMLTRKERWGLSWRGYLVGGIVILAAGTLFVFGVYPFLAITEPVEARTLVVEGWVDIYAIRFAAHEFKEKSYERAFTTGGPLPGTAGYTNDDETSATLGATRLKVAGVPESVVQRVPSRINVRNRTYGSAVALRT